MLGKLINFGKKNDFYLELDNSKDSTIANKVEAVATQIQQEAKQVVKETKQALADSPKVPEIKSENKQTAKKAKSKAVKASAKDEKPEPVSQKASTPVVVDTSYSEEPFWVKLMYKTSKQQEAEKMAEKTFATDYLIAKPKSRRRPGGSLDKFKTMARQSKAKF